MNRFISAIFRREGYTLRGLLAVAGLIALGAWLLLPKYLAQVEKTQALSMQAMLVNTVIAEYIYYNGHQAYTANWRELMPFLQRPETLQVRLAPADGNLSEYFFGFGPKALSKRDGYAVTLRLNPGGDGGTVLASRTGSVSYGYELLRPFPEGETQCIAQNAKEEAFCQIFLKAASELELKRLIPAPRPAPQDGKTAADVK